MDPRDGKTTEAIKGKVGGEASLETGQTAVSEVVLGKVADIAGSRERESKPKDVKDVAAEGYSRVHGQDCGRESRWNKINNMWLGGTRGSFSFKEGNIFA